MNKIDEITESVVGSNYIKSYIDENIRRVSNNKKELYYNGRTALTGILTKSTAPILMGVEPKIVRGVACELMLQYSLEYFFSITDFNYGIFNNLLLLNKYYNSTTQLDSVVLSNNCIIVIECKSLFGESIIKDSTVYTRINLTNKDITVTTPWKQNMSHILTLKDELSNLDSEFANCYYENLVFIFGIGRILEYRPEPHKNLAIVSNIFPVLNKMLTKKRRNTISNYNLQKAFNYLNNKEHNIREEVIHIKNLEKRGR